MEQNAAIKVKGEILSPSVEVLNDSKISEEKYQKACEVRDEYRFRYLHFKQRYEKVLEEKEALLKESDRFVSQTEMWALKAQVESLKDELEGCRSKVDEYKTLFENSCVEKEEIIRKSLEKVEQRALEAQVASLQDELQAYAECRAKLLQQEELYRKVLMENESLKANSTEFRALELQVASLQDELTRSNQQCAELSRRYAEKEKQFSDLEGRRCPSCRVGCSSSERHRLKNELAEGLVQDRNVLEELKKQRELVVQLEEERLRLEAQVKQDEHEIGKLREAVHRLVKENPNLKFVEAEILKPAFHKIVSNEDSKVEEDQIELDKFKEEVDKLMNENPSLKPAQMDTLKGDHSARKPVVNKIVSQEEDKVEEDQVELDKPKEEVDNLVNENSSLRPVQVDVLKGNHSTKKQAVHKITSKKKEEGKGKRTRRRKTTDEGITVQRQDKKTSVRHASPSPLCETGTKEEQNLRKRRQNQSNKVTELTEEMKGLNLKPEKKEKVKTKRASQPRRKKVQDENDPTQDNKFLQSESKITRVTRSQRKKAVSAVEKRTWRIYPNPCGSVFLKRGGGHFCCFCCNKVSKNMMDVASE